MQLVRVLAACLSIVLFATASPAQRGVLQSSQPVLRLPADNRVLTRSPLLTGPPRILIIDRGYAEVAADK